MLDLENLREEKHEKICRLLDMIMAVLLVVFFVLSFLPYFSVKEGESITSRGYSIEANGDDSWTLMGYVGFPYNHESVEDWQAEMYKENKDAINENEDNDFDGLFGTLAGELGRTHVNDDGETVSYVELAVPGITTKTVSIKQVGAILFLDVFAAIGAGMLLTRHKMSHAVIRLIWAVIGVLCLQQNYLLNMCTNWVRGAMLVVVILTLVISLVDTIFYAIDAHARNKYLASISAAYA